MSQSHPASPSPEELTLAQSFGIQPSYTTIWGTQQFASSTALSALLHSLSPPLPNPHPLFPFDGTLVSPVGTPLSPKSLIPFDESPITILWEDGSQEQLPLSQLRVHQQAPLGYHQLLQGQRRFRWVVHPAECYFPPSDPKLWGLNIFLPSLRNDACWGCGDFTTLLQLAQTLAASSPPFDYFALNPLHAIANRRPYNTSPYSPLSLFARNALYLDLESLPEFSASPSAQRLFASPAIRELLAALRSSPEIQYQRIARLKLQFLWLLFRDASKSNSPHLSDLTAHASPFLLAYAQHETLNSYLHRRYPDVWHWKQWPEQYRDLHSPAAQAILSRLHRRVRFHLFVQTLIDRQLESLQSRLISLGYSLGLYHDLALSTDRVGADTWASPHLFAENVRVGSPPDDFNREGQDWGFPALRPTAIDRNGYNFFVESLRSAASHGGAVRLDHVMRLARLYWIPDGLPARDGAYVSTNHDAYLGILALESARNRWIVIGEDLGTVPELLRDALSRRRVLSYRLILFERDGPSFRAPEHYPEQAVASFTTHDLTTFDGWLSGADLDLRYSVGHLSSSALEAEKQARRQDLDLLAACFGLSSRPNSTNEFFSGLVKFFKRCPSRLILLNLDEFLAESSQQNLPGTTHEYPNWCRPYRLPVSQFTTDPTFTSRLNSYAQIRSTSSEDSPCEP